MPERAVRGKKRALQGGISKVLKHASDRDCGRGASERVVSETVGGETFFLGACINRAVCFSRRVVEAVVVAKKLLFHAARRGLAADAVMVRHRGGDGSGEWYRSLMLKRAFPKYA